MPSAGHRAIRQSVSSMPTARTAGCPVSLMRGRADDRRSRHPVSGHPAGHLPIRRQRHRHSHGCHGTRSEEHTSELQSRPHLVCRLLLEKKKKKKNQKICKKKKKNKNKKTKKKKQK